MGGVDLVRFSASYHTAYILFDLEKKGLNFKAIYLNFTQNGYFVAFRKPINKIT